MRMLLKISSWWTETKSDSIRAWAYRALFIMSVGVVVANAFRYLGKNKDAIVHLADLIATGGVAICFGVAMWKAYQDRQHGRRKQYLWLSALSTLIALGAAVIFGHRLIHSIF